MVKRYKKILLAVDFHEDNASVVETAKELSELYSAELHVAHVNEPLGMAYAADGVSWGDQIYALEESIRKESKKKMTELGNKLGVAEEHCYLLEGRPASEIHNLCTEADLISSCSAPTVSMVCSCYWVRLRIPSCTVPAVMCWR